MPFVRSVSSISIALKFIGFVVLFMILAVIALSIIHYPLDVKNLLTGSVNAWLSVPIALVHGFMSLVVDFVDSIVTLVQNTIVKPLQGAESSLSSTLSGIGSSVSSGLSSVGSTIGSAV